MSWKILSIPAVLAALCMIVPNATAQDARTEARRLMAKFDSEPNILEVQRAASRYARVNPDAYDGWLSSARLAYLMPKQLEGRIRYDDGDDRDVRTTSSGSGSLSDLVSTDQETVLEATIEWDLTRIVFNRDQITAARQIERIVNQREDLLTTVNKLYFARRQSQIEMEMNPPGDVQRAIRMQLRIDALTADIDALTGGWFSEQLRGVTTR